MKNTPKCFFISKKTNLFSNINKATINDLVAFIKSKTILGIDIETSRKYPKGRYKDGPKDVYRAGLDPFFSKIVMVQIGDHEAVYVIDARDYSKEDLKPITDLLHWNTDLLLVGHNLKFEGKHFKHNYGISLAKVWDTMLCEMNITNGLHLGYGLADLAERYLGIKKVEDINLFSKSYRYDEDFNEASFSMEDERYIDKSTRLGFINIGDKPFTETQILYGVDDVIYPLSIRELQLKSKYNPINCHNLENAFSQVLVDLEINGLGVNIQKWLAVSEKNLPHYRRMKNKLDNYVIDNVPAFTGSTDLFSNKGVCVIQWSSSDQVIELFKYLGFCPKEKSKSTKKLEYTVGEKALSKLLDAEHKALYFKRQDIEITDNQTLILNYLIFKKYEILTTTFGKKWLKYIHPITGRVHSNFRQILNTGRISSTNPNQQNIPGTKEFRECFDCKSDLKLLNADYSSQEIRILAEVSENKEMQDFFIHGNKDYGDDFHSWVANKAFKIIYDDPNFVVPRKELEDGSDNPEFKHKKERNTSKGISFKIGYGGSAFTMKDDFGVTEEKAQVFIDGWFASFPGLEENFERTKKQTVKDGFVLIDSFTNRKWFFKDFDLMKSIYREVQSLYPEDYRDYTYQQKQDWKAENKFKTGPLWKKYFTMKSSIERKGLNYRIQGNAGGMMKLATIFFRNWIMNNNIDYCKLTNIVHDEVLVECVNEPDKLELVAKKIQICMEKAGTYFCKKVPMKAEAVIADYWTH